MVARSLTGRPRIPTHEREPMQLTAPHLVATQQTKRKHVVNFSVDGAPMFVQTDRRFRGLEILPQTLLVEARIDPETNWHLDHVSIIGLTPSGEPKAIKLRSGKGELRVLPEWARSCVDEVFEDLRRNDGTEV